MEPLSPKPPRREVRPQAPDVGTPPASAERTAAPNTTRGADVARRASSDADAPLPPPSLARSAKKAHASRPGDKPRSEPATKLTALRATIADGARKGRATSEVLKEVLLASLADGAPFDGAVAARLEALAGRAITREGLEKIYAAALPNTRVRLAAFNAKDGVVEWSVSFVDNLTDVVATVRRKLKKHDDGALELYAHGAWVDETHRGLGVSSAILAAETKLLAALSSHPRSRLTLWAGGASNPKKRSELQMVGVYAWAAMGFDFACAHGLRTTLGVNTDRARCPGDEGEVRELDDRTLVRRQLHAWLERTIADGTLALDDGARRALEARLDQIAHPWEVAQLTVPGTTVRVKIGEVEKDLELGKAFLLSAFAPRWEGVFFVNHPRSASAKVAREHLAKSEASASKLRAARELDLGTRLSSSDPEVRKEAVEAIGATQGSAWIPRLTAALARDAELAEVVERAIARIEGRWRPPAPIVHHTPYVYTPQRFELPRELAELETLPVPALVERIRTEKPRVAGIALQLLAENHAKLDPELVRAEARALFERLPGDDTWTPRRWASDVLGKLPEGAGLATLAELAPKEDDINVLVSMHRWLDAGGDAHAAAASELDERIEAMKEEIRIALAEL